MEAKNFCPILTHSEGQVFYIVLIGFFDYNMDQLKSRLYIRLGNRLRKKEKTEDGGQKDRIIQFSMGEL